MNLAEIGDELKKARDLAGLSQAELAEKAKMSRSTISLLERGFVSELGVRKILNLCDFLNLELTVVAKPPPPLLEHVLAANVLERRADMETTEKILRNL